MLDLKNISLQLDEKRSAIQSCDAQRSELTLEYRAQLEQMKLLHPVPCTWKNRMGSMEWVDSVRCGVPVGAVDGSQIYSDKNYEIPLAVIQISRIFNRHTSDRDYSQDT